MLNLKSLLTKILTDGVFKDGATMTGQLKTSYKNYVACGSYSSSQTTISDLITEVRYSSGAMGSVTFSSNYVDSNLLIPAGNYQFLYIPHRFGGINGTATSDNCNYGNLFLINVANNSVHKNRVFVVRLNGGTIKEYKEINTTYYTSSGTHPTKTTNSYYSLNTSSSWIYTYEGSRIHMITLYVDCTTAQTGWQNIGIYSYNYKVGKDFNFSLTNSAGTVIQGYLGTDGNIYVKQGYNGHGFKGTFMYLSSS